MTADLVAAARRLRRDVEAINFARASYRYNPLLYAWEPHQEYLRRYGQGPPGRTLLVGMNPGPWGMAQTGVPFGDPVMVRDWMGIDGRILPFPGAHQRCPVMGFASHRREGSGTRLYGWAQRRYGSAEAFFARNFVLNYFPLLLLDSDGINLTPAILPASERSAVAAVCDPYLREAVKAVEPSCVAGVGKYATEQVRRVVAELGLEIPTPCLLHPSPANPMANSNWEQLVESELCSVGVVLP
jgi:single-strand selective monofunctional uracil DNA glycosylase